MSTLPPAELDELRDRPMSSAPPRRRRRRRLLAASAVLVVAALVVAGLYAAAVARSYDENRRIVDAPTVQSARDGAVDILLIGSDSRAEEESGGAPADVEGRRSDTLMLVHLPEDRSAVYVMSILRDLSVQIPGRGRDRINSAFSAGGHELTLDTVEQLLGVPVHHIVEVDFQGFRGVTDALGGIEVCNPTAFSSGVKDPSYYPRGSILLAGTAALRYVRERHAFADGDLSRVENQQRVVSGALDRFLSVDVLADPTRTTDVVSTLSRHLSVDAGLDSRTVAGYAWDLRGLDAADVRMFTVPHAGGAVDAAGRQVVLPDEERLQRLRRALAHDDVAGYLQAEDAATADRRRARAAQVPSSASAEATQQEGAVPAPTKAVEDPCA